MALLYITLLIVGSTMAQKSPYASSRLPGLLPRFQQNQDDSGIGGRVGIPSTTLPPALQGTLHEDQVVARVSEWPEERQPFWFKNRQVVNSQIQHSIDGGTEEILKNSQQTKFSHTKIEQREEEQKLKQKIEYEHNQQELEKQKLKEEIERQAYEEEIERKRIEAEFEKQQLKEELEREILRQERERQKLEEEKEEQRLRHEREHEKLIHQQQLLHIKHFKQTVQEEHDSGEESHDSKEAPFWKTQKNINSGMRINKNGFTTTERPKKKFFNLF